MVSEILALTLAKQLSVAVPSIVVGTQTLTASLKGIFKIENSKLNRAISWLMAVLVGIGFVAFNGLAIVTGPMWVNYIFGAVAGFIAGIAANGFTRTSLMQLPMYLIQKEKQNNWLKIITIN